MVGPSPAKKSRLTEDHSIGPLAARTPGDIIAPLIDKLTDLTNSSTIDVSVPNTALRTLIASLPQPQALSAGNSEVRHAYSAISKVLIPRLVGHVVLPSQKAAPELPPGLLAMHPDKGYSSDAIDVLIEMVKCYGTMLQELEVSELAKSVMAIVESSQAGGVVKKRALAGMGALLIHFGDKQLNQFASRLIDSFQSAHTTPSHRRYLIATIGTLARSTPSKFGPYIKTLAPFILSALSQGELDEAAQNSDEDQEADPETEELREAALVALEAILGSCAREMLPFMSETVDASLRFLKYDPNVADVEDEDMGGTQDGDSDDGVTEEAEDEDDEYADLDEDGAFSDVDDLSWKARRCAAKALYTIILGSSATDHGILFDRIAPVLISRMNLEREENVKLEIIAALAAIVKRTGPWSLTHTQTNGVTETTLPIINTRKRRRQDSGASLDDFDLSGLAQARASPPVVPASPPSGAQADLAALIPKIAQALTKMWKKATISLKQAAVSLLRSLALTRNGALADFLQQIEDPIADALKPSTSSASTSATSTASATVASLQIETLALVSAIAETNSTSVLLPFVIALIPSVTCTVRDRNYKVSSEALAAIEQFVKALTPPRLPASERDNAMHLEKLYDVTLERVTDINADLEVRHRAIQVFGILIARTSSTTLLTSIPRARGLQILNDRLRNETTRLSSARAIGTVGAAATEQNSLPVDWVRDVSLELGAQLRKSDRSLRGSCLEALKNFALNPSTASHYDSETIRELAALLLPLLSVNDLHLLTPALVIIARIVPTDPHQLVQQDLIQALCQIVQAPLVGSPLRALLLVVRMIGEQGVGESLMKGFLNVGTSGDATVVGRAIGTLVVFGGPNVGVNVEDFLKELESAQEVRGKCLALAVLGEIGFRMGSSSPLDPDTFLASMNSESDKVRLSAAVALGSAGTGNVTKFLPLVLDSLGVSTASDYLYLHAVKEILQHPDSAAKDIAPYAKQLWEKLFAASDHEDNRAVGAECIGRLALIEPGTYVPELQHFLQNSKPMVRGTVIAAFRFTLADSSESYTSLLRVMMVPLLKTMLSDADMGNRRLAVTTLNSAIHNKSWLVIPELQQLLPMVFADSYVQPELIRVVSFGPFKINVDDGLDLRKACYETFYALLDAPSALPRPSIPAVFERLLDGVPDDHDVRTLCNLMITKLTYLDPDETRRRLSALADKFKLVLGQKVKENAVKQEIEKVNEANAAVIRTTLELDKHFPSAATDGSGEMLTWKGYLEWVKKDFAPLVRTIQEEAAM